MIYLYRSTDSGSSAIVDVSLSDSSLLKGVCRQIFEAIRNDDDFVPRTGYPPHSYKYLSVWMMENGPDAAQRLADRGKQEAMVWLKNDLGSPTASEFMLAIKIDDIDTATVRWNLSRDALLMFDAGIREILDYFADDDPPYAELQFVAHGTEEEFRTLQQKIKDILVDLPVQKADSGPPVVSATTLGFVRDDAESVAGNDELVAVELTADERDLLWHGLLQWWGPAGCTAAMAIAMGFDSVNDFRLESRLLMSLINRGEPMSRTNWTRTLLATEVCFASDVLGAGGEWPTVTGYGDTFTIVILRVLQRKLAKAGALAQLPNRSSTADFAAKEAARGYTEEYASGNDESVAVKLTADERWLLTHGLLQWGGPARCTEAMAIAIGFDSVDDLDGQYDRLKGLIDRGEPMSRTDWTRTLLATEICFASDVLGAGVEWPTVAGGGDTFTIDVLRGLQNKLLESEAMTGRKWR